MKLGSRFLGQAIKAAGVGAVLMLSVSAGYAQSGPFAGFAANLTLRTNGNKQTVQISSKGEIRGVTITMVKS
jgi:hypothetical protein